MEDGVPGEHASCLRQEGNGSREYEKGTCCRKGGAYQPDQDEIDIQNAIDRIHDNEPAYGCRRIKYELRKLGFTSIGKQRTVRYMREMNVVAFYPGPHVSKRDLKERTYPYLLRGVSIAHVNHVWGMDYSDVVIIWISPTVGRHMDIYI